MDVNVYDVPCLFGNLNNLNFILAGKVLTLNTETLYCFENVGVKNYFVCELTAWSYDETVMFSRLLYTWVSQPSRASKVKPKSY